MNPPAVRFCAPSPALRTVVQALWCVDVPPGAAPRDGWSFMHPDGGAGLIINVGCPLSISHRVGTGHDVSGVLWEGVGQVSARFQPQSGQRAFGVRFWPGGARALWGAEVPLSDVSQRLAGAGRPLRVASGLRDLADQLAAMPSGAGLMWLDQWLRRTLQPVSPAPVVSGALKVLPQAGSVADAVQQTGVGRRTLERHFVEQVGLSPKRYMRLARLAQARDLLKARARHDEEERQVDIALRLGYYDEAHFIRDFQSVVGMTPGGYMQRSRAAQIISPVPWS